MQLQTKIENNTQDNFAFLKDGLEELYNQAILAERYYFTDPQSSLVKIRLFVELACHELGKHFKLRPPVHGDLSNKIKMLQSSQLIDDWVLEEMNALRHDGNRSVHMTEVNGAYIAKLTVSRHRMQKHMNSLYEIAHYVGQTILGTQSQCAYTWQEPTSCELSDFVTDALKGCKEASYYLANKFYQELLEMSTQTGEARWWKKEQFEDKQTDLRYWLNKAHKLGHSQTWLLFAKSYANKLLTPTENYDAKHCYKQALKTDESGEAAFEFGSYLIRREEFKLGEGYIRQSAELGYHPALEFELEMAFKSGVDKTLWLERSIEHRLPQAFTADAFLKLEAHEIEGTDLTLKALRSSIVCGQARRAPGIAVIKAYTDFHAHESVSREQAIKGMVDNYECMPAFLNIESRLYKQISHSGEHLELMNDIYHKALQQSDSELEQADIKYSMVKQALAQAAEKFKVREGVKTPRPIPELLKEAADAGHTEARTFVNSAEGKAVLKKVGFTSAGKMQKNAAEKQKQKRKRKLAKKAKRK